MICLIWHCTDEFTIVHRDGYDICNECYVNGAEIVEDEQNESLIIWNEASVCKQGVDSQIMNEYIQKKQKKSGSVYAAKTCDKIVIDYWKMRGIEYAAY